MYTVEQVSFEVEGDELQGLLLLPESQGPVPGFVAIGPVSSVKEQSPIQYATRLAKAGAACLVFDHRGFGASGGAPRQFDSPERKVADLHAAARLLADRPEIDTASVTGLGICMGCNWVARAVADGESFTRAALIVGAYSVRSRRIDAAGGKEAFEKVVAQARLSVDAYEQHGELTYQTLVAEDMENSYFSWPVPYHWYKMWTDPGPLGYRGLWRNELATISDYGHYLFDAAEVMSHLDRPTLVVNSRASATPLNVVEDLFAAIPHPDKRLVVTGDQIQTQFYDDPLTIDQAVAAVIAHTPTLGQPQSG